MFKIHTCDGNTARVDLQDEEQATIWLDRLKDQSFQKKITGITIMRPCAGRFKCPKCNKSTRLVCGKCGNPSKEVPCGSGIQHSLSRPSGYDDVFYQIEYIEPNPEIKIQGGERITCFAGDTGISLMVHLRQPASRITLLKTGKRRYNPYAE